MPLNVSTTSAHRGKSSSEPSTCLPASTRRSSPPITNPLTMSDPSSEQSQSMEQNSFGGLVSQGGIMKSGATDERQPQQPHQPRNLKPTFITPHNSFENVLAAEAHALASTTRANSEAGSRSTAAGVDGGFVGGVARGSVSGPARRRPDGLIGVKFLDFGHDSWSAAAQECGAGSPLPSPPASSAATAAMPRQQPRPASISVGDPSSSVEMHERQSSRTMFDDDEDEDFLFSPCTSMDEEEEEAGAMEEATRSIYTMRASARDLGPREGSISKTTAAAAAATGGPPSEGGGNECDSCQLPLQKPRRERRRRSCWKRFQRRVFGLSTCVALPFIMILIITGAIISQSTFVIPSVAIRNTWEDVQIVDTSVLNTKLFQQSQRMFSLGTMVAALYSNSSMWVGNESTMSLMCSMLYHVDPHTQIRGVQLISQSYDNVALCTHGDASASSMQRMAGGYSNDHDHIITGTYVIDPSDFTIAEPPVLVDSAGDLNVTAYLASKNYDSTPLFKAFEEQVEGKLAEIPRSLYWRQSDRVLHSIVLLYPMAVYDSSQTGRDELPIGRAFTDTRIEAQNLFSELNDASVAQTRIMVLSLDTVDSGDPVIIANDWGQPVTNDTTSWSTWFGYNNHTVLHTSGVHDHLMRVAMTHLHWSRLSIEGYTTTKYFLYNGAPALVTMWRATTDYGLSVGMVLVNAQCYVSGSYWYWHIAFSLGLLVVVILLVVGFWCLVEQCASKPLRRLTYRFVRSAQGHQFVSLKRTDRLHLAEVHRLFIMYNRMVPQLRAADTFVPAAMRQILRPLADSEDEGERAGDSTVNNTTGGYYSSYAGNGPENSADNSTQAIPIFPFPYDSLPCSPSPTGASYSVLEDRVVSVVTMVQAAGGHHPRTTTPLLFGTPEVEQSGGGNVRAKLQAIHFARARRNSGIAAMSDATMGPHIKFLMNLATSLRGVIHHMSPDITVVHFGSLRRGKCAQTHADIRRAANLAVQFSMACQRYFIDAPDIEPVTIIVDTTTLTCGPYYSIALGQTFFLSSGRSVQDDIGYVYSLIGVKVGLTEETAVLVQDAVRVLPLEALYVGRAEHSEYTLVLYEALPGAVDLPAWQLYQSCFYQAFLCMTAGKYSEALALFDEAAAVEGLEAELVPEGMRSVGQHQLRDGRGSVDTLSRDWTSSQLDRLTAVCAHHIIMRDTERYIRRPLSEDFLQLLHVPLNKRGVAKPKKRRSRISSDAPLAGAAALHNSTEHTSSNHSFPLEAVASGDHASMLMEADPPPHTPTRPTAMERPRVPLFQRCIALVPGTNQRFIYSFPDLVDDHHGERWSLAHHPEGAPRPRREMHVRRFRGMNPNGVLAIIYFLPFKTSSSEADSQVLDSIQHLPLGVLEDPQSVPLRTKSAEQSSAAARLFPNNFCQLNLENTIAIHGYNEEVEGGIIVVEQFFPGGNLHELMERYATPLPLPGILINYPFTASALHNLHSRGLVHGHVCPHNILVGTEGYTRLKGFFADDELARRLLQLPYTMYVSPEEAAGGLPTAASDVFALGLILVEILRRQPPWRWADGVGEDEAALKELLDDASSEYGHHRLCAAIHRKKVVPALEFTRQVPPPLLRAVKGSLEYSPTVRLTSGAVVEMLQPLHEEMLAAVRHS